MFYPFQQAAKHGPQRFCSRKCVRRPLNERFWEYVQKSDDCWLWIGNKDKDGYGMIGAYPTQRKNLRATHASWMLHHGEIPESMRLCHKCDTPSCVNPQHLFLGTDKDNHHDSFLKGRRASGEKNGNSKLTVEKVIQIRHSYATGNRSLGSLGREYGVSYVLIRYIVQRKVWNHI